MDLYLDCSSGVSGDMLVGSLLALLKEEGGGGGPLDAVVRPALSAAGIDPSLVAATPVRRGGMAALSFTVVDAPGFAAFAELIACVEFSPLADPVVRAVVAVARRLAAAEAEVHGSEVEHLHELSAIDTAVDLIAAAALLHHLAPERVVASPPALGDGVVRTAHGELAVPVPAVLSLLRGWPTSGCSPVAGGSVRGELTTPTGAALLTHIADVVDGFPAGRIVGSGCGAGLREVPGRPNILRAVLIDSSAAERESAESADVVLIACTLDDMSAELVAGAAEALRRAGALDVWVTPALMKKGRPGVVLYVLAAARDEERLAEVVFRETTTFGVRISPVRRRYLDERRERVAVRGGEVAVRLGFLHGHLVTASPEYEDVRRVAAAAGSSQRAVFEAASAAAHARFREL